MNNVTLGRWPEGKPLAITFSYDDGHDHDRRLVEIFNRHGIKATFNLNSGFFGRAGYVTADEVATLYAGHEVAVHTFNHPVLVRQPPTLVAQQVMDDRRALEELTGSVVDGMAYPFGDYNDEVIATLKNCGIRYSRTCVEDRSFKPAPADWLAWHPTCHDRHATPELLDAFFNAKPWAAIGRLLYIWGHGFEFERPGGWESIETLCATLKERGGKDVWFATNGEIRDYVTAVRGLRFNAEHSRAVNDSAVPVWVDFNGKTVCVAPCGG